MIKRIAFFSLLSVFVMINTSQAAYRGFYSKSDTRTETRVKRDKQIVREKREKVVEETYKPARSSDLDMGFVRTAMHYPTGKRASSAVTLEKHFPKKARVGKEFTYMIEVTNLTDVELGNVNVTEVIPSGFKIVSSEPEVSSKIGSKATWQLGSIPAQESVMIKVTGKASNKESAPCCAEVDYAVPALCHQTILEQPDVSIALAVPGEKLACDLIDLEFTVENTGDSYLENLVVSSELPDGVTTSKGTGDVEFSINGLAAGESETVNVLVSAEDPGQYRFKGSVSNDDVSDDTLAKYTKVVKPSVSVDIQASRADQYLGRSIDYVITVKNTSGVDAESTMVVAEIPSNAEFKSASNNGRLVEDIVGWEVGTLNAYESKKLELSLMSTEIGEARTKVGVQASCCEPATDTAETKLVGIPALLLEVVDIVDPIEVGQEQTYVVKVTNQGTANAHDVKIIASLDGMDYISDTGDTSGTIDSLGAKINFTSVDALSPKDSASWKIKVKGNKTGDLRFKVSLTSEELTKPVEEAESTYVY